MYTDYEVEDYLQDAINLSDLTRFCDMLRRNGNFHAADEIELYLVFN